MRLISVVAIAALAAGTAAYAQDAAPQANPAEQPPTNRMEQATPTMKAPDGQQQTAPTGRVGEAVPTMKSDSIRKMSTQAQGPQRSLLMNSGSDATSTAATAKTSVKSHP